MPDVAMTDLSRVIDGYYDGPHSAETVTAAGQAITSLVRYLANATQSPSVMPYVAHVDRTVSHLYDAAAGLGQVLDQLGAVASHHASRSALYDDRRDRPAGNTVRELLAALDAARVQATVLARHLDTARQASAHLGNG